MIFLDTPTSDQKHSYGLLDHAPSRFANWINQSSRPAHALQGCSQDLKELRSDRIGSLYVQRPYENLEKFWEVKKIQSVKRDLNPLHSVPHTAPTTTRTTAVVAAGNHYFIERESVCKCVRVMWWLAFTLPFIILGNWHCGASLSKQQLLILYHAQKGSYYYWLSRIHTYILAQSSVQFDVMFVVAQAV